MDKAYEIASALHGHSCPGLAIGVRAAEEAKRILNIDAESIKNKQIYCVAERRACYLDGIQALSGCTVGNGHLLFRATGKTAFSFFHTGTDESVRLVMKDIDGVEGKAEKIQFILHAPLEDVFSVGPVRAALPEREPGSASVACAICGEKADESALVMRDGKLVCLDCAET